MQVAAQAQLDSQPDHFGPFGCDAQVAGDCDAALSWNAGIFDSPWPSPAMLADDTVRFSVVGVGALSHIYGIMIAHSKRNPKTHAVPYRA